MMLLLIWEDVNQQLIAVDNLIGTLKWQRQPFFAVKAVDISANISDAKVYLDFSYNEANEGVLSLKTTLGGEIEQH